LGRWCTTTNPVVVFSASEPFVGRPNSDEFDICALLHIANVTANGSIVPTAGS
jgi:hypothetical protein